jgi:hypothetical protein
MRPAAEAMIDACIWIYGQRSFFLLMESAFGLIVSSSYFDVRTKRGKEFDPSPLLKVNFDNIFLDAHVSPLSPLVLYYGGQCPAEVIEPCNCMKP